MHTSLFALALIAAGGFVQAGEVEIRYVHPDRFVDAGYGPSAQRTRLALSQHLVSLGDTLLPARRSLAIEVLDIDLAGEPHFGSPWWPEPRVLLGKADWPMIALRYTLREGDLVIGQGEERLTDLGYLTSGRAFAGADPQPFMYEKRMLSEWFKERFAPGH